MRIFTTISLAFLYLSLAGQKNNLEQYISKKTKEINVSSDDFKGLEFLDTILANKRIVFLGESSHGTEEYSQTKLQLIKYLHEKLGFNVILFESPMTPGCYFNLVKDTTSADKLIRNTIQTIWQTKTILKLFDYMKENNICFGGIDPQFLPSPYPQLLFAYVFNNYPEIKKDLLQLERRISEIFKSGREYSQLKDSFSIAYAALATRLEKLNLLPIEQWIRQIVTINISYYAHLNKGNQRDSCMARNLIWLAENLFLNEKIIVWAHNSHIDKNSNSSTRFMGKLLSEHFNQQIYVVGFYMINGSTALNSHKIIQIKKAKTGSLEDLLSARGFKTAFIETNDENFNRKIMTLHWGKEKQQLNLFRSYDAVLLINGVTPPEYLKE